MPLHTHPDPQGRAPLVMTVLRIAGARSYIDLGEQAVAPGYDALRRLILPHLDGQEMERVAVLHEGKPTDMFVGDCSAIAVPRLPRNEAATAIYRCAWLTQHPSDDPEGLPAIHGPAVLFSRRVWF